MHKRKVNGKKAVKLMMRTFREKFLDYHTRFINKHFSNLTEGLADFEFKFYLSNTFDYPVYDEIMRIITPYGFVNYTFLTKYEDKHIIVFPYYDTTPILRRLYDTEEWVTNVNGSRKTI